MDTVTCLELSDATVAVAKRILVVDDNEQILRLVQRLLSRVGFDVQTASHPEDALALCEASGAPDLLISDVRMPFLTGPQMYDRIRAAHGECPVLYISADAGDGWEESGVPLLEKPFSREDLISAIATLLPEST